MIKEHRLPWMDLRESFALVSSLPQALALYAYVLLFDDRRTVVGTNQASPNSAISFAVAVFLLVLTPKPGKGVFRTDIAIMIVVLLVFIMVVLTLVAWSFRPRRSRRWLKRGWTKIMDIWIYGYIPVKVVVGHSRTGRNFHDTCSVFPVHISSNTTNKFLLTTYTTK